MKYLTRTTVLFAIAAALPLLYIVLELIFDPAFVPLWLSNALLLLAIFVLAGAVAVTVIGFNRADQRDLRQMADDTPGDTTP